MYQCETYNCTLEKYQQMKVHRMFSVKKYISFSHPPSPLTYLCRFLFYQMNNLLFHKFMGMIKFEWFFNNACSCHRCFFTSPKNWYLLNFLWVTGKPLFFAHNHVCEKLGYLERLGKQFLSENYLKIYLDFIGFIPYI